ncbi:MAG: hypothetical protein H7323_17435, partial [Frankiales bacterium]|nr:hypothetical protein [Frankiales bacterium]
MRLQMRSQRLRDDMREGNVSFLAALRRREDQFAVDSLDVPTNVDDATSAVYRLMAVPRTVGATGGRFGQTMVVRTAVTSKPAAATAPQVSRRTEHPPAALPQ